MNNLLVAVKSCYRDLEVGCHDVIRATWGQAFRGKIKFFIGRETQALGGVMKSVNPTPQNSYSPKSDEVILDCRDDYDGLVYKTREICRYVMSKNISHILMVDVDCCVFPKRIEKTNYEIADYAGFFNGGWGNVGPRECIRKNGEIESVPRCYSWARGGGYFLSRRAAAEIADTPPKYSLHLGLGEDFWVGQVLGPLCAKGELLSMPFDPGVRPVVYYEGGTGIWDCKSGWMEAQWRNQ